MALSWRASRGTRMRSDYPCKRCNGNCFQPITILSVEDWVLERMEVAVAKCSTSQPCRRIDQSESVHHSCNLQFASLRSSSCAQHRAQHNAICWRCRRECNLEHRSHAACYVKKLDFSFARDVSHVAEGARSSHLLGSTTSYDLGNRPTVQRHYGHEAPHYFSLHRTVTPCYDRRVCSDHTSSRAHPSLNKVVYIHPLFVALHTPQTPSSLRQPPHYFETMHPAFTSPLLSTPLRPSPKKTLTSRVIATPSRTSSSKFPICTASPASSKKPRTVGIAGAGIAGLATALALLNTPGTGVQSVSIFEPRQALDLALGGPLNINGAAAILTKCYGLDLRQIGHRVDAVTARAANGRLLFHLDVDKIIKADRTASSLLTDGTQHLLMTVMRDQFQSLLYDSLNLERVVFHRGPHRKVVGVVQRDGKASFILAGGEESELFDLIVGADGLRSNVRTHIANKATSPQYSGLRVQWAVSPTGVSTLQKNSIEQWFGNGGYALRFAGGPGESPTEALALTFRENRKVAENAVYKDESTIRTDFEKRLIECGLSETLSHVAQSATKFIETGVYYHRPLPTWSTGGVCVLVGDAGKYLCQMTLVPFSRFAYKVPLLIQHTAISYTTDSNQFCPGQILMSSSCNATVSGSRSESSRSRRKSISPFPVENRSRVQRTRQCTKCVPKSSQRSRSSHS